jgi:acetoin utilization deacetylase AcuC-like enzyme
MSRLRPLRRLARRLTRRLGGRWGPEGSRSRIPLIYHPRYRRGISGIPLDALRGERIATFLLEEGWVDPGNLVRPRPAPVEALRRVHSGEYLRSLDDPEVVGQVLGLPVGAPEAREAVELQRLAAGGTMRAGRLALERRGPAFHLGGGFHHAGPDRGGGLCLLNDVAVAIAHLRARGFQEPILVVDLDIHDGNGTRAIFAGDASVHTFSIHNRDWDDLSAVADTRLAVGPGVEGDAYLELLQRELPPVVAAHRPGLTFYVAGADVARDDAYGDARLDEDQILERDRFVVELLRETPVEGGRGRHPLAVVLGGGYGPSAWRPAARFAGWLLAGRPVELPDDLTVSLRRVRWMEGPGEREAGKAGGTEEAGRGASRTRGRQGSGGEDLFRLSPEDLAAVGAGPVASERLLLGRISPREVEEGLARFGILEQIRARGYPEPRVELLPSSGLGPTMRLFGSPGSDDLLMELRVDEELDALPSFALLGVQWLLLQDPRSSFSGARTPFPGQAHPGLGVLADVVAWLVTLCRETGLDGLAFRSSHFHMAALARRHLRFLHPGDEARFHRILALTDGMSLSEASRAVAAGTVMDPGPPPRPLHWVEVPMVVPVSPRLRRYLGTEWSPPPPPPRSEPHAEPAPDPTPNPDPAP